MKKLFLALIFISSAFAQEKMYQVPESQLTEQQKAKFQGTSPKELRDWVGLGKEIGQAVDSSLSAVSTQANNFAQTPVGKLTVAVVIFKVIGDTAVHILVGTIEIIVLLPLWLWSYRKWLPRSIIKKEIIGESGKIVAREYEMWGSPTGNTSKITDDYINGWRIAHWFALCSIALVVLITIFSY